MIRFSVLLNQVWGLERCCPFFTRCVGIAVSSLFSAGLPCFWLVVEIKCRLTRRLGGGVLLKDNFKWFY